VINFRYHVVSLTAVFLALAIGLVVGTAALNGPAADALSDRVNALTKQNQQYREQVGQLESEAGRQEQFATEAAPIILANKLTGRRVVLISMQGTASYVDGVAQMLNMAGAKVTGRVEIEDKFTNPDNNEALLDLAHTTLPQGVSNVPLNSNGAETSSFLLASVLLEHTPSLSSDTIRTVISAFKEADFIVPSGDPSGPAEAAVIIAGAPYTDRTADSKNSAVLTTVAQFEAVGTTVVSANGAAGAGNVITAVRGDPTLSKSVSTVDNVATPQGRVAAVLALAEQMSTNKAGHYGLAGGATSILPKLTSP
jgi:hypothetical protein